MRDDYSHDFYLLHKGNGSLAVHGLKVARNNFTPMMTCYYVKQAMILSIYMAIRAPFLKQKAIF